MRFAGSSVQPLAVELGHDPTSVNRMTQAPRHLTSPLWEAVAPSLPSPSTAEEKGGAGEGFSHFPWSERASRAVSRSLSSGRPKAGPVGSLSISPTGPPAMAEMRLLHRNTFCADYAGRNPNGRRSAGSVSTRPGGISVSSSTETRDSGESRVGSNNFRHSAFALSKAVRAP